jgi:uncharacterized protein
MTAQSSSVSLAGHPVAREGRPQLARLFDFFARHPVASALGIWIADLIIVDCVTLVAKSALPWIQPPDFLSLCVDTVVIGAVVLALGWRRVVGFNGPAQWREPRLLILPALVVLVVPLLAGFKAIDPATTAYLVLAYVLTGLREETLYRGLILRVLGPIGPARAAILTAVLFGSAHLSNLLVRANPMIVFAQVIGAFCDGLALGAIRLRSNTLWFPIAIHFVHDLVLNNFTRFPLIPLDVAQDTVLLIYGIYLLRHRPALHPEPAPAAPAPAA